MYTLCRVYIYVYIHFIIIILTFVNHINKYKLLYACYVDICTLIWFTITIVNMRLYAVFVYDTTAMNKQTFIYKRQYKLSIYIYIYIYIYNQYIYVSTQVYMYSIRVHCTLVFILTYEYITI